MQQVLTEHFPDYVVTLTEGEVKHQHWFYGREGN